MVSSALAANVARAHFVLESPPNWAEQDSLGAPQKSAPCGQADAQLTAIATNAVTAYHPGEVITVAVDEVVYHPGHYRVVLSTSGRDGLPADPVTTVPGTCMGLSIQDPPVFPVLADGMLLHSEPFEGPQSFSVTLPKDVTCTHCTLQVLEFMSAEFGASANCFYHHCADITISAAGTPPSDGGAGGGATGESAPASEASCAIAHRTTPSTGLAGISCALVAALFTRRRRRPSRTTHVSRGALGTAIILGLGLVACGNDSSSTQAFTSSPGNVESLWLRRIGVGPPQTAAACAQGAADPIARALCQSPTPALRSLSDLYGLLEITPGADGDVAVTTHSLGLSARTVSALNPRTFAFRKYSRLTPDKTSAVAFSRGQPLAELMGYDPDANVFRFYVLAFRPACERSGSCSAADLLSARIESDWLDWTLYTERDLEDTPLNCSSCHRADGAQSPSRLLMRQIEGPWMHWGDFRGVDSRASCLDDDGNDVWVDGDIPADGADLLAQLDGPDGLHGGIPITKLMAATSGYDLSSFMFYAAGYADGPGDVPCVPPNCPLSEPHPFPSQKVLCDRLQRGSADVADGAWRAYRAEVSALGLPVPYFEPDVLDPALRSTLASDFEAFLTTPETGAGDAFSKLSGLMSDDVARAIGFLPEPSDSATVILTKMCVRCHSGNVDAELAQGRSRFNASALDQLGATEAREIIARIRLPRTSPELMPPLLAGELPEWAQTRIEEFLNAR
jgi:hypothetical protein